MSVITDIKNASILLGKVTDAQLASISKFPLIALENVDSYNVDYNLDQQEAISAPSTFPGFIVSYNIKTKNKRKTVGNRVRPAALRLHDIQVWVKNILWEDVTVEFYVDGKAVKPKAPKGE